MIVIGTFTGGYNRIRRGSILVGKGSPNGYTQLAKIISSESINRAACDLSFFVFRTANQQRMIFSCSNRYHIIQIGGSIPNQRLTILNAQLQYAGGIRTVGITAAAHAIIFISITAVIEVFPAKNNTQLSKLIGPKSTGRSILHQDQRMIPTHCNICYSADRKVALTEKHLRNSTTVVGSRRLTAAQLTMLIITPAIKACIFH